jgi:drug/metabolite transporter (DMT)-like permease
MSVIQAAFSGKRGLMTIAVAYILISVVAGGAGQILLKQGMTRIGEITLIADQIPLILWRLATNPFVVGGLTLYAGGTVFWLAALSRVDLSFAYPFASLSYIIMLLASWQLFNENITLMRLAGTMVIGFGVFLISRS